MRMLSLVMLASAGFLFTGDIAAEPEGRARRERSKPATQEESVEKKLRSIIIPEITFNQAHIKDVILFLIETSRDLDPAGEGVNIILKLRQPDRDKREGSRKSSPASEQTQEAGLPLITFRARNLSLLETLNIVSNLAGLRRRVEGNVVFLSSEGAADDAIIHRVYDVLPIFEHRIRDVSRDVRGG